MAQTHKKLSQKALTAAATRAAVTHEWCWNYERMQATGFAYEMIPVLRELYDTDEEVCERIKSHLQFYNTHPGASEAILGACVALEEDYQTEMADSLKVALMGPMAGIGDTVQAVLVKPIAYILAASLAADGSFLALPVLLIPFLILWAIRFPLFKFGYSRSVSIIQDISGNTSFARLQEAAQIVGLMVVGGFVPSMVGIGLTLTYTKEINGNIREVHLQDTLDGILPYLLPICVVAFCYWMIKQKKMKPTSAILVLAIIAFVLGSLGIIG